MGIPRFLQRVLALLQTAIPDLMLGRANREVSCAFAYTRKPLYRRWAARRWWSTPWRGPIKRWATTWWYWRRSLTPRTAPAMSNFRIPWLGIHGFLPRVTLCPGIAISC